MSVAEALLRMVLAMGVVLGLLWASARLLRSRSGLGPLPRRKVQAPLEVLARQPLSRSAAVAVVRTGGKAWLLGVTDQSVTLLTEADLPEELEAAVDAGTDAAPAGDRPARALRPAGAAAQARTSPATIGDLLELLRTRTARR